MNEKLYIMFVEREVSPQKPSQIFATRRPRPGDRILETVLVKQQVRNIYDREMFVALEFVDCPTSSDGYTPVWMKKIIAAGFTPQREYANAIQVIEAAANEYFLSEAEIQLNNFSIEPRYYMTEPVLGKVFLKKYYYRGEDITVSFSPQAIMPQFEIPWEGFWCRHNSEDCWAYRF